jgi:hypothetical protein
LARTSTGAETEGVAKCGAQPVSDANASQDDTRVMSSELLQQTNKRLTLNLLIQGAAAHAFLTAHHLAKDDLEAIRPGLTELHDRVTISAFLNYWIGDVAIVHGMPARFWRRTHRDSHPFHRHRLLAAHGSELSNASKQHLVARGRMKRVVVIPGIHLVQMFWLLTRVALAEQSHHPRLAQLAKRTAARIWDIEESRLDAALTTKPHFGNLKTPQTWRGRLMQRCALGFGGVVRRDGQFKVVAKAYYWPLVLHELVKGTAELICLHGLNTLDDETYEAVTDEADRIEYECWLMQAGPELWRRLLAVLPHERPLAEILMHMARLDPAPLERLMLAVVEDPGQARELLGRLA